MLKYLSFILIQGILLSLIIVPTHSISAECCQNLEQTKTRVEILEKKSILSDTTKITISGQLSRGVLWLDNGVNSNFMHVDNDSTSSRIRITGTKALSEDLTIGSRFETEFRPNSTAQVDVHDALASFDSAEAIRIRKAEVMFESKAFGSLSLGRGNMASDGTMEEADFSGTTVVALSATGAPDFAGGARFTNKATNQKFTANSLGSIFNSGDGLSRKDRIRYSSPSFNGLVIDASHAYHSQGDLIDLSLRFATAISGIRFAALAAVSKDQSIPGRHFEMIDGSVGVLFPLSSSGNEETGIALNFATAHKDWDIPGVKNGHVYFGKIGYVDLFNSFGKTAFAIDAGTYRNMAIDPVAGVEYEGDVWGIFVVQHLDVVATELYAGYRHYQFKRKNTTDRYNDINAVLVGARVKL